MRCRLLYARCGDRCTASGFSQGKLDLDRLRQYFLGDELYALQEAILDPLLDETIGRKQAQRTIAALGLQGFYPGIELLRGQFLLEAVETNRPEIFHRLPGILNR